MTQIRPNIKKSEWKLSPHEFYEVYHYALQYVEWKDKYNSCLSLSSVNSDGMPSGSGLSDTTYTRAVNATHYHDKMQFIEETVKETDENLAFWLLKAVTHEKITYNYLRNVMNIPCGKNYYYDLRRKFYWLLHEKLTRRRESIIYLEKRGTQGTIFSI